MCQVVSNLKRIGVIIASFKSGFNTFPLFVCRAIMTHRFTEDDEINGEYRRFNSTGTQLTVRLLRVPPPNDSDPVTHFLNSMSELFGVCFKKLYRLRYGRCHD